VRRLIAQKERLGELRSGLGKLLVASKGRMQGHQRSQMPTVPRFADGGLLERHTPQLQRTFPIVLTGVRAIVKDWGPLNGFPFMDLTAKRGSKLSNEQKAHACKRFVAGKSYQALAREFGIGETTMFEIVRTWGPENGYPYIPRSSRSVQMAKTENRKPGGSAGPHQGDLFD
jgi:CENP-B N-terminal DNA-binding domain